MSSTFKKDNDRTSKPSSLTRSTSDISYGDSVDASPTLVTSRGGRTRRSCKTSSRGLTTGRFDSTIISISSNSMGSRSSASNSPLFHRPPIGIADLVLQPCCYRALLLQASANRDPNERPSIPTITDLGTGMHSKETQLDAPHSTPSHDPIRMDTSPAIFVNGVDSEASALMEGITYDTVLASTLHKSLGMTDGTKYWNILATRTLPNSLAAIQEGRLGSLMGVSMAIMEGGT